jgi:hypothetical protein
MLHIVPLSAHKHNIDVARNLNLEKRAISYEHKNPNAVAKFPAG